MVLPINLPLLLFTVTFHSLPCASFSFIFFLARTLHCKHHRSFAPTIMVKKTATKGKRTASKAVEEDASLKKVDCDWGKSSVKAQDLDDLRRRASFPPWRR